MSTLAQLNARIPAHSKQLFAMICTIKGEHQEQVITRLIDAYVAQEHHVILDSLKERESKNG